MSLTAELTAQLRRDEGEKLHAYQDHLGYWTIGVGRLIDPRKGGGISRAESAMLLANDIDQTMRELLRREPWIGTLSLPRQGVLINMAFQMGVDGLLKFKNTLKMIEQGEYEKASEAMLQSLWAQQTPNRAYRLSRQMRLDAWE